MNKIDDEWPTATNNDKPVQIKDNSLKGVYRENERQLYRAAIRPPAGQWYTLGYFVCPHAAAYVFNIYALTMNLTYLYNKHLEPNQLEVQKWRDRKPENLKREAEAITILEDLINDTDTRQQQNAGSE